MSTDGTAGEESSGTVFMQKWFYCKSVFYDMCEAITRASGAGQKNVRNAFVESPIMSSRDSRAQLIGTRRKV